MDYSSDLGLALAIIKYKHKKKLRRSYASMFKQRVEIHIVINTLTNTFLDIINYTILPRLNKKIKIKKTKPRHKKPKPTGKSIIPILKTFNIVYETKDINEFKRETLSSQFDVRDISEIEELLYILKYLIQWDNLPKHLFLIHYITKQLVYSDFLKKDFYIADELKKISTKVLRGLDECILYSICNEKKLSDIIKYKFIQMKSIYKYIFSNLTHSIPFEPDNILEEFILNIAKIVFFKLGKWILNNKRYLIKFISGLHYSETVKFEVISLIIKSFSFNQSSTHLSKLANCLKDKLMNPMLLNYLITCYLKLIKAMLKFVELTANKCNHLKRKILALLIINNDAEPMEYYQINF